MLLAPIREHRRLRQQDYVGSLFGVVSILSIVGILLGTYLLPISVRRSLVFEYGNPTVTTAYTAHFVHLTPSHLLRNLSAFVLVSGLIVFLAVRANDKWFLVGLFTTLFFALPLALSYLNLAIPRDGVTYGFSGLNMALVGALPIAIARYTEIGRETRVDRTVLPAVFFLSATYIAAVSVPPSQLSKVILSTSAVLGSVFTLRMDSSSERRSPALSSRLKQLNPLLAAAIGIWIALLSAGFPDIVAIDGSVINIYVHFLGYAIGFTVAYLVHEWRLFDGNAKKEASSVSDQAD